jgi:hypothetical protein
MEGFARFLENRTRNRLGLAENTGGARTPYNRISFYYGGDRLIRFLSGQDKTVMGNIELLYARIFGTQQWEKLMTSPARARGHWVRNGR